MKNRNTKKGGQAIIIAVLFFLFFISLIVYGAANPIMHRIQVATDFFQSQSGFYLSEAKLEDLLYRMKNSKQYSSFETLTLNGNTASTTIVQNGTGKVITASGIVGATVRQTQASVSQTSGLSYGIQVGGGGLSMSNSSSVTGNIFSNGPISGSGNSITGDAVSASSTGSITNIKVGGDARAHVITNSTVGGNAYYSSISGTTVTGTSNPNTIDTTPISFPITDTVITALEQSALAGGTYSGSCPYDPASGTIIGPIYIACTTSPAMRLDNNGTFTFKGNVWVAGDIDIGSGNVTYVIDPSIGAKSVAIIAHKASNTSTGSKITVTNSPVFQNSGVAGSYIVFISQNNSKELGGTNKAITISQSSSGEVVYYAAHGLIDVSNSITARALAGYGVATSQKANLNLTYQSSLGSILFQDGPPATYTVQTQNWKEIQ